jgi:predicted DNA-binding transcriptional regulator AlpA
VPACSARNEDLQVMSRSIDVTADDVRPGARLLNRKELLAKVNLSYPTIWALMRDGTFPHSRAVDGKTVWVESEVDDWIARLPRRRLKGETEGVPYRTRKAAAGTA